MPDFNDQSETPLIQQLARIDFNRAHHRAFWREVAHMLSKRSNRLMPFDAVRQALPLAGQHYLGMREVPVEQIVGSESRYHDFDSAFLPRQRTTQDRWMSIDRAHLTDVALPPVELYKVGESYYVKDGNHRVSVARQKGQAFIDAVVVEVETGVPAEMAMPLADLVMRAEEARFERETHLHELIPEVEIHVSVAGMVDRLLEHIAVHRYYLGEEEEREIPPREAVRSWYEQVYTPLVEIIRDRRTLRRFPGRTETDLYIWIIEHRGFLQEESDDVSLEDAARNFAREHPERLVSRVVEALRKMLQRLHR